MKGRTNKRSIEIITFDTLEDAESFIDMCETNVVIGMYQNDRGVHVVILEVLDEE